MSWSTADRLLSNSRDLVGRLHKDSVPLLTSATVERQALWNSVILCEICITLALRDLENIRDGNIVHPFSLSLPTSHVRRNVQKCAICRLLARLCFAKYGARPSIYDSKTSLNIPSSPDLMRKVPLNERIEVSLLADGGGGRSVQCLRLTTLPEWGPYTHDEIGPAFQIFPLAADKSGHAAFGCRPIDLHRIDLSLVKRWLSRCEEKHKISCDDIQCIHLEEDRIFWTIDVRNKRLRQTCNKDRFVALSYVFEGTAIPPFVATEEEFFTLVDRGTSLEYALEKLPRTIVDAMLVVLEIGETLLWVDGLCIPPGSRHRAAQIAFMDQIYGSAALTVVVAYGDNADPVLTGARPGTRRLDKIVDVAGPDLALAVELPYTSDAVTKAPWNNQGWTYQERLLSKRLLILADETTLCQGKLSLSDEEVMFANKNNSRALRRDLKLGVDRMTSSESSPYFHQFKMQGDELFDDSDFWEYTDVVEEYSKRNLTLDSDILAAFSGLSRGFAWVWKTDLLWGLPESWIDAALLWEKDFLSNRNPHLGRQRPTSVRFPSWTWAGWKGSVRYEPGNFDSAEVDYTRPCVGWFALKDGKLRLLGLPCSLEIPQGTVEDVSSRIHQGLKEDSLCLKAISVAHQVPTDFCFINQMLYGYTTTAPILHFIYYLLEPSGVQLAKLSGSTARMKSGRQFEHSVQFRNHKQEITGGAELNGECLYEAHEIDLVLLSERRRLDKNRDTDVSLGYRVMLVKWDGNGRTAMRVGLGRIDQRAWWDATPRWREIILT